MIATVTTSSGKTRQRGHALSTLSLTSYILPSGFLFVSIVTWPVLPHHLTPTPLPVPSSFYTLRLVLSDVTSCSRGGHRDSQLRVLVAGIGFRLSHIYYYFRSINCWLCCSYPTLPGLVRCSPLSPLRVVPICTIFFWKCVWRTDAACACKRQPLSTEVMLHAERQCLL